jgi:ubiquinone/menaquinone biosynthesis C-methylase UbiE
MASINGGEHHMAVRLDPQGEEVALLHRAAGNFAGRRVLEIGSGDGRLTWRYARDAAHVTALDPDREAVEQARRACPADLRGRIDFVHGSILHMDLPARRGGFDLAIYSWSL